MNKSPQQMRNDAILPRHLVLTEPDAVIPLIKPGSVVQTNGTTSNKVLTPYIPLSFNQGR
jgi:hypothetical protein